MLVSSEGRMGQGKTATLTFFGVLEYKRTGCKIFANYHLNDVVLCPRCKRKHAIHKQELSKNGNSETFTEEETEAEVLEYFECEEDLYQIDETSVVERIPYTYLTVADLYSIFSRADQGELILSDCVYLLDEAYLVFDSRTSGSKQNRLFNSFAMQTRKRGVDMYISTHDVKRLDQRIRSALDLRITCRYHSSRQVIALRIRDMHTGERRRLSIFGPIGAFPYYDTQELVRPTGKLYRMKPEDLV